MINQKLDKIHLEITKSISNGSVKYDDEGCYIVIEFEHKFPYMIELVNQLKSEGYKKATLGKGGSFEGPKEFLSVHWK